MPAQQQVIPTGIGGVNHFFTIQFQLAIPRRTIFSHLYDFYIIYNQNPMLWHEYHFKFSIWKMDRAQWVIHWRIFHFFNSLSRVTHISVSELTIIGSDNGLSPGRRQAIIWINAGILLIGVLGTNFNEILVEIHNFHSRKSISKCRLENDGHFVSASMC